MSKILVIGYGNTLRGDDAAGVLAAEAISKQYPEIKCISVHQLTPELAEDIAECDIVIFIDADVSAKEIIVRSIFPSDNLEQPQTHFVSPESLLTLSQQLYLRLPAKAYTIGIPAVQFEFGERISETAKSAIDSTLELVKKLVQV